MPKLIEEIVAIVKASPYRYLAPVIGAVVAARAVWSRPKRQS